MARSGPRRVLCVFPRYAPSFGTFNHAFPLVGVKAFMPPQGILVVAGYLPQEWDVRFVDENVAAVTEADLDWAEAVFMTGMHVQRPDIGELNRRAQRRGCLTVLGGPSVSGEPSWYPEVDVLHVGELGDATDRLIERVADSVERPAEQEMYVVNERLPIGEFPIPAYEHLDDLGDYLLASVQWSSGCPYRCEFCDIPELYGRRPRLKSPQRVTAELDAMLAHGNPGVAYFVDDNFVGNPKAARELLEELVRWQEARGFPLALCCEGTLNMAKRPELLELMRQANMQTVFCGIESPDEQALRQMKKQQNLSSPILDAVRTINSYGIEVVSGIIVGLDTDTAETYPAILRFIAETQIPVLTINLLYALPRTPLWRRLEAEGRIVDDLDGRGSNVEFLMPYETVKAGWSDLVGNAFEPAAIYSRFRHQIVHTYPNRRRLPPTRARLNLSNLRRAAGIAARMLWHIGIRADYRREFWRTATLAMRAGEIEGLFNAAMVSHHMISFARSAVRGDVESSFYSPAAVSPHQAQPLPETTNERNGMQEPKRPVEEPAPTVPESKEEKEHRREKVPPPPTPEQARGDVDEGDNGAEQAGSSG